MSPLKLDECLDFILRTKVTKIFFKNWIVPVIMNLLHTAWKVSKYGVFSGPYFPLFGLNTEIYGVNLRIQTEYRKIRTRKVSVFGNFSRSVKFAKPATFQKCKSKLQILIQVNQNKKKHKLRLTRSIIAMRFWTINSRL